MRKKACKIRRCLETSHFAGLLVSTEISTGRGEPSEAQFRLRIEPIFLKKERSVAFNSEVTPSGRRAALQMARGPRNTRTGRKNSAASRAKTPCTAMPTMRNGSVMSQTIGNSTTASKARGQHKINRMHHRKNAAMSDLLIQLRMRNPRSSLSSILT